MTQMQLRHEVVGDEESYVQVGEHVVAAGGDRSGWLPASGRPQLTVIDGGLREPRAASDGGAGQAVVASPEQSDVPDAAASSRHAGSRRHATHRPGVQHPEVQHPEMRHHETGRDGALRHDGTQCNGVGLALAGPQRAVGAPSGGLSDVSGAPRGRASCTSTAPSAPTTSMVSTTPSAPMTSLAPTSLVRLDLSIDADRSPGGGRMSDGWSSSTAEVIGSGAQDDLSRGDATDRGVAQGGIVDSGMGTVHSHLVHVVRTSATSAVKVESSTAALGSPAREPAWRLTTRGMAVVISGFVLAMSLGAGAITHSLITTAQSDAAIAQQATVAG